MPRYGAMADINMTPFIDVMLVLLIIFMVAAPLLTTGVAVDLPQAKASGAQRRPEADRAVAQRPGPAVPDGPADRRRRSGRQVAGVSQAGATDQRIYVRASKIVPYGRVAEIMGEVTAAGFKKVALVTEPTSKP